MVNIQEVRDYLNVQQAIKLPDSSISSHIKLAEEIVEKERKEDIPQQTINLAVLAYAGYTAYIPYAAEMERSLGVLPPTVQTQIDNLKALAEMFLAYIKGERPIPDSAKDLTQETISVSKLISLSDLSDSAWSYRYSDTSESE